MRIPKRLSKCNKSSIKKLLRKSLSKLYKEAESKSSVSDILKRPFPDFFYRGLSSSNCFTNEGYVSPEAFSFKPNTTEVRADSFNEASINWEDDVGALSTLLSQINTRNGELQFKFGYVRMPLIEMLPLVRSHMQKKHFGYERRPIEGNPYHGNLLIDSRLKGVDERLIKSGLALVANAYVTRLDTQE